MKIDIATLLTIAAQGAQAIERLLATQRELRAVVERESPQDLAEFDARVAAARTPSQTAADRATRENATSTEG